MNSYRSYVIARRDDGVYIRKLRPRSREEDPRAIEPTGLRVVPLPAFCPGLSGSVCSLPRFIRRPLRYQIITYRTLHAPIPDGNPYDCTVAQWCQIHYAASCLEEMKLKEAATCRTTLCSCGSNRVAFIKLTLYKEYLLHLTFQFISTTMVLETL